MITISAHVHCNGRVAVINSVAPEMPRRKDVLHHHHHNNMTDVRTFKGQHRDTIKFG